MSGGTGVPPVRTPDRRDAGPTGHQTVSTGPCMRGAQEANAPRSGAKCFRQEKAMIRPFAARVLCVALFLLAAEVVSSAEPPAKPSEEVKAAVARSLPLLLKGAEGHMAERTCFACHNQGIPLLALTTARQRGFAVRDEDIQKQLEFIA